MASFNQYTHSQYYVRLKQQIRNGLGYIISTVFEIQMYLWWTTCTQHYAAFSKPADDFSSILHPSQSRGGFDKSTLFYEEIPSTSKLFSTVNGTDKFKIYIQQFFQPLLSRKLKRIFRCFKRSCYCVFVYTDRKSSAFGT